MVTSVLRAHQLLLARADAALTPFALAFARFELLRPLAVGDAVSTAQEAEEDDLVGCRISEVWRRLLH